MYPNHSTSGSGNGAQTPRRPLRPLLAAVYGNTRAPEIERQLRLRLDRFAAPSDSPHRCAPLRLSSQDVLLITYADQVRATNQRPLATLDEFCEAHLRDLVSGIHILPFYPSTSDDGFAVQDYCAVDPALGTWADIRRLGRSFDLMFDAVLNHMSARADWFLRFLQDDPEFRDFFVTVAGQPDVSQVVRPRTSPLLTEFPTPHGPRKVWTTFSADQVDLNYRNPAVLLAVIDVLLFYAAHGARFLRLDAIAFLWKELGTPCLHQPQTHALIRLIRAVLDAVAPWVLLITETNVPHADNIAYFGDGSNEAQLVYNFALPPLVLHSFTAGNAIALTRWARSLAAPSDRTTFLNFLASHDGIGLNPVRGILSEPEIERLVTTARAHGGYVSLKALPDGAQAPYELNINYLDALSDPAGNAPPDRAVRKLLTAHAILLSLEGVPAIYFHSLFGSRGDAAGAETSGIKRRINRAKCQRAQLERELADPRTLRAHVFAGFQELLRARRGRAAFDPQARQTVLDLDDRVFALLRQAPDTGECALCLHNVAPATVRLRLPENDARLAGPWSRLAPRNGTAPNAATEPSLTLEPHGMLWLAR